MPSILRFEQITERDRAAVGGKGYQLARLAQAGLAVPPGFCVTTEALEDLHDPAIREAILVAYRALSGGPVAVRSSAVIEDSAEFSFAGQFETILNIDGDEPVLDAIGRCFVSRDNERVRAYRRQVGATAFPLMGVIVQRFINSEFAGVLFTRDPGDDSAMLVEAGRGTSVVSGAGQPERVQIDRTTRKSREAKNSSVSFEQLAELGLRIEAPFGAACDIEWAFDGEQFWVLQARPITTADPAERAAIVQEEIANARKLADPAGTVWARQNLADVLPHPTPMTWALMQRMLSGDGGLGCMYRDFGCTPDSALAKVGVYDLLAGRPYLNLSREPRIQYGDLPLGRAFARLKANPAAVVDARAELQRERVGFGLLLQWPVFAWRLRRMNRRIAEHVREFTERFRTAIVPGFLTACVAEGRVDYDKLMTPDLLARFEHWCELVLRDFARHSLKAGALADHLLDDLRRTVGADSASQFASTILADLHLDAEIDLGGALRALAAGTMRASEFIERFGHRGWQEMELSQPRFDEMPPEFGQRSTIRTSSKRAGDQSVRIDATASHVERLREFAALRETAKHWLMFGTAQLRRQLVEFDRRFGLDGGVFFLMPAELPGLAHGEDYSTKIAARRRRWAVLRSLSVPTVLFSDDLEAIGRPPGPLTSATNLRGIPLSAGFAEGPALVLREPAPHESAEPYVLVCPTSEPAWTPLMLGACAVVFEAGGILSHGAIVAREFGLPAVGGVSGVMQRFRGGERLRVDGNTGIVTVLDECQT
jgi:pyruvate,water dikinase